MVKAVDPAARIDGVRLLTKEGGKRGSWRRDERGGDTAAPAPARPEVRPDSATVLVASTGGARGTRPDTTGPAIAEWLTDRGYTVRGPLVYADADIAAGLADALADAPALVLTTGGTGAPPPTRPPKPPVRCSIGSCRASPRRCAGSARR